PLPPVTRVWRAAPGTTRRAGRLRLPHPRLLGAVALVVLLAGAGWWWGRDSALVAVHEVRISGLASNQTGAIRTALTAAAQDMTTLHVDEARLRAAVAAYPVVAGVRAEGDFPHLLRIEVVERAPVAVLKAGGQSVAVAADGTLLRGLADAKAPSITLAAPPAGTELKDPLGQAQVRILAAAPAALRERVTRMFTGARGMQAQLQDGPVVAFGAPDRLAAKWAALVAVLGDESSAGATLIDLTVPESPAAAGLEPMSAPEATGADATAPAAIAAAGVQTPATTSTGTAPIPAP
ncbi:MAG: FtsQ-type protein, partial [Solirubrobacterales bacterium]|nr:FtsQ-type protein [Solirubrobacterales bacterium]